MLVDVTPMSERAVLGAFLAAQRDHVLGILEGLTEADLRRPVLPSGWSCLGLVQHLTLDVERFWFRAVMGGDPSGLPEGDEAWVLTSEATSATVFDAYRAEIQVSDRIIADRPLDGGPAWWPRELFPDLPPRDLRRAILHVTTETACHAGHLDAVRELIDGRQWLVLTETSPQ
jgi:hypothetical protein